MFLTWQPNFCRFVASIFHFWAFCCYRSFSLRKSQIAATSFHIRINMNLSENKKDSSLDFTHSSLRYFLFYSEMLCLCNTSVGLTSCLCFHTWVHSVNYSAPMFSSLWKSSQHLSLCSFFVFSAVFFLLLPFASSLTYILWSWCFWLLGLFLASCSSVEPHLEWRFGLLICIPVALQFLPSLLAHCNMVLLD